MITDKVNQVNKIIDLVLSVGKTLQLAERDARGTSPRVRLQEMDVTVRIPDEVARHLAAKGGDVSRITLEALALEGYREQILTLHQVTEMLGLSRVETEDFLGHRGVSLAIIQEQDLEREAALFDAASRRDSR